MATLITVTLSSDEIEALRKLAELEFRDTRSQAALIIRQELERRGLLQKRDIKTDDNAANAQTAACSNHGA